MTNMFSKSLRLTALGVALAAAVSTAAEPTVHTINDKQYYITGADVEIATWKYGALGVYTTIHDDWGSTSIKNCYDTLADMNNDRGLITSTAAISGYVDQYYATLGKEFIKQGHEIHCHSVTHTQGMSREEIFQSKADLEAIFNEPMEFYVFPFDQWDDAALQHLRDADYIGARSGNRYPLIDAANASGTIPNMTNPADFEDGFALQFDVFPRSNSAYKKVPDNGDPTSFLKRYVSDAIDHKGWAIQEFHDINDNNSLSIPVEMYASLLDSVASAQSKNQIWSSGPTEVIRYRFAREYAGTPALSSTADGYKLAFGTPTNSAKLNRYNTPLTVFFRAANMTAHIAAYQNGVEVPSRKIDDGYFALEANPINGEVTIVSAPKPYMPYPFVTEVDTVPSNYPQWLDYAVYSRGGTHVYHNGSIWKNAYWVQYDEPGVSGPWSKVSDVTEKAVYTRVSKGGSISPVGKTLLASGASQKITVAAEPGYEVDYVNVNGVNVGAVYEVSLDGITKNYAVEAVLSPIVEQSGPTWTITSTATAGGSITPEGARTVREGGSQAYAIEAATGNRLDSVLVNGVNEGAIAAYTFRNVTADGSIAAYFSAIPTYTITASVEGPGSVDPATATVTEGDNQVVSFAADANARLDSVLVNGTKVNETVSYTFTNVTANGSLVAYFSAVPQYSIEATSTVGGSINPEGVVLVKEGESQLFTTAASNGYDFYALVVDGDTVKQSSYTFPNVVATHTIKAVFEEVPTYNLTVTQSAGGTITPSSTVINEGAAQTIVITPNEGYDIVDVVVNGVSQGAISSYDIPAMNSDVSVSATFAIKTFTITATAGLNGSISPAGETVVEYGASQEYIISADVDYEIDVLKVNGKAVTAASKYNFASVKGAQTIEVTFKEVTGGGCADIQAWNANDHWTSYSAGDLRSDNGKIYECTNVAYSFYQPSGAAGSYGWKEVGTCN